MEKIVTVTDTVFVDNIIEKKVYVPKYITEIKTDTLIKELIVEKPVEIIKTVKDLLDVPLIVGGGIRTANQLDDAYKAGADLVVVGTAFEEDRTFFDKESQPEIILNK